MDNIQAKGNVNQELLGPREAAAFLKISPDAYRKLRDRRRVDVGKYLTIKQSGGYRGQTTYISKEGLLILATIKNEPCNDDTMSSSAKTQFVEKAIEAVTPSDDDQIRVLQEMIEQRRRQIAAEKRIAGVEERVGLIEAEKYNAQQALFELPAPRVSTPMRTERSLIREAVSQYVRKKAGSQKDYALAWEKLYIECNYRLNMNLTRRARESGADKLTILEREGALTEVYAIAKDIFGV
jgi:hypothetical protein